MDLQLNGAVEAAIRAALECRWQEAIFLNQSIINQNPNDCEALNRLAKAHFELGQLAKAKAAYQKVLTIDPYNPIALKNLQRIEKILGGKNGNGNGHHSQPSLDTFLGEPGRTKLVSLVHLATPDTLSSLREGEKVELMPKKHCVAVCLQDGPYLGAFPDDISHLLISLINAGNQYDTFIKSTTPKRLVVLIKETFRSKKLGNQPSFIQLHKKTVYRRQTVDDYSKVIEEEQEEEIVEEII